LMAGESLSEDDMFSYGDLVQYLEQADMPDQYSQFWDLVTDAINSAGGFGGQGSELAVDKNIAPQIKTLYQQFKAATAKIKGVKESNDLEDRAEKMVLAKLMKEYKGYESMVANAPRGSDDQRMFKDRLRDLANMIKYVQGKKPFGIDTILEEEVAEMIEKAMAKLKGKGVKEDDVDAVYPGTGDIYGYTWNCKKCGTENEFSMSRQDAQEYIDEWEADNEDLVADGETGSAALIDSLAQGEDSGFHYGSKCAKCGTEAKDPSSEDIDNIIRLSGLK